MPRQPRDISNTGIYHIMVRGLNKMNLFNDKQDKQKFLETLSRFSKFNEFSLYAYCLMDNHVHLLVKEEVEPISISMKRICVSYSYYFNKKYNRVGHVFQDRFRSERIENDGYLLQCIRYIHNNPIKADIVTKPENYYFSSYRIYIDKDRDELNLLAKLFPLSIFSENNSQAIDLFKKFSTEKGNIDFIDIEENNDQDKLKTIENILNKHNLTIENLAKHSEATKRDLVLKEIKKKTSIPVTEISKITGISKYIIYRA